MYARLPLRMTALLVTPACLFAGEVPDRPPSYASAQEIAQRQTMVIAVKRPDVERLADIVNQVLLHEGTEGSPPPGLVHDLGARALIITGTEQQLDRLHLLIAGLDAQATEASETHEVKSTVFRAEIYQIELPREQVPNLSVSDLHAHAATAAGMHSALSKIGHVEVLYRFDQVVRLQPATGRRDTRAFSIGSRTPFHRGERVTDNGQINRNVEYQDVGCSIQLSGTWHDERHGAALVRLELSGFTDSSVTISEGLNAPVFRNIVQIHDGSITAAKPIILLSVDGSGAGDAATAYVTRIQLDAAS